MRKKIIRVSIVFLFFMSICQNSFAVDLEAGDWKFGINGFLDGEYTYMEETPMVGSSGKITKMNEKSYFGQRHLNLLFGAEREKMRVNINLKSTNLFHSEDGETKGNFEFEEAYGQYSFNDHFKIRAGSMIAPFGIYNEVRYITPLFATVVLPQMYEMPSSYKSGNTVNDESVTSNFMPTHANVMLTGNHSAENIDVEYYAYISNGERSSNGTDTNKNKGYGARVKTTVQEDYKFGVSYYSVKNDKYTIGREHLTGFDVELNFVEKLKLEMEYVMDDFTKRKDRHSYYVRLTGYADKFTPFISYDYAEDEANSLYKRGQSRYSVGTGYNLSQFVTLKAEFHYHKFNSKNTAPALPAGTDTISMFKGSMIFVF